MATIDEINDGYESNEDDDYEPTAAEIEVADKTQQEQAALAAAAAGGEDPFANRADPDARELWDEDRKRKWEAQSREIWDDFLKDPDSESSIEQSSSKISEGKVTIVQKYDFCGSEVTCERVVDAAEAEKIKAASEKTNHDQPTNKRKRISGLDVVLTKLAKQPRMTVIDKSNTDWQKYVKKKELTQELNKYDRSKESFIDNYKFKTGT